MSALLSCAFAARPVRSAACPRGRHWLDFGDNFLNDVRDQ
jgi:hypothetical protein